MEKTIDIDTRPRSIDATTKVVGVIGYPVAHSLSPQMHNSAFNYLGLNFVYLAWEVEPSKLEWAIEGVRGLGIVGLNVTIPHKEKVVDLLDDLSEEAEMVRAVNTIHNIDGKLLGYNTDVEGFRRALGVKVEGKKVVVLGAGGAGRAVLYALLSDGASCILLNRTEEKAKELEQRYKRLGEIKAEGLNPTSLKGALSGADILVNATSLGMKGELVEGIEEALVDVSLVMDLVYNPRETPLLKLAKARGAKVVEGWKMLLHQGAFSFEIWTGQKAPLEVMEKVLQKILYGV